MHPGQQSHNLITFHSLLYNFIELKKQKMKGND